MADTFRGLLAFSNSGDFIVADYLVNFSAVSFGGDHVHWGFRNIVGSYNPASKAAGMETSPLAVF